MFVNFDLVVVGFILVLLRLFLQIFDIFGCPVNIFETEVYLIVVSRVISLGFISVLLQLFLQNLEFFLAINHLGEAVLLNSLNFVYC